MIFRKGSIIIIGNIFLEKLNGKEKILKMLKNVLEKEVSFKYNIGIPDSYWSYMNEVSVSAVMALKNADEETIKKIKEQLFEKLNHKFPDGDATLDANAIIIYGQKC